MLSSYLRATLGHSYLTACKGKGPSKWWNKGKNCGFIEKGELALKCCAIVPPVTTKNFNTEDMIFFSAPAYIYSNDMHQGTVTRMHQEKLSLHNIMAFSKIMVITCMLSDRKPNKTTVYYLTSFESREFLCMLSQGHRCPLQKQNDLVTSPQKKVCKLKYSVMLIHHSMDKTHYK